MVPKAFNELFPIRLLLKRARSNLNSETIERIKRFRTISFHSFIVRNQSCSFLTVMSGAPPSSIRGPLLFLIHRIDLPFRWAYRSRTFVYHFIGVHSVANVPEPDGPSRLPTPRAGTSWPLPSETYPKKCELILTAGLHRLRDFGLSLTSPSKSAQSHNCLRVTRYTTINHGARMWLTSSHPEINFVFLRT